MIQKLTDELTKEIGRYDKWSYAYQQGTEIHVCNDGVCDSFVFDVDKARVMYEPKQGTTVHDKILAFIAKKYLVSKNLL